MREERKIEKRKAVTRGLSCHPARYCRIARCLVYFYELLSSSFSQRVRLLPSARGTGLRTHRDKQKVRSHYSLRMMSASGGAWGWGGGVQGAGGRAVENIK